MYVCQCNGVKCICGMNALHGLYCWKWPSTCAVYFEWIVRKPIYFLIHKNSNRGRITLQEIAERKEGGKKKKTRHVGLENLSRTFGQFILINSLLIFCAISIIILDSYIQRCINDRSHRLIVAVSMKIFLIIKLKFKTSGDRKFHYHKRTNHLPGLIWYLHRW